MDCPSEEAMIRMKLDSYVQIEKLDFDIPNRKLTVFHNGNLNSIQAAIAELKFKDELVSSEPTNEVVVDEATSQRKMLWAVLLINFVFFGLEMTTGIISRSMGLIADSLDMLADSFVYALSLLAVGGSPIRKKNIAKTAGYFQMVLAIIGFIEVIRRFTNISEIPNFNTMIIVSILALIANGLCLYLLQKSKSKEAHMQASMIFTSNDVIINSGVIVAGVLVLWTNSRIPDLIIGAMVFVVVIRGSIKILKLGK